MSEIIATASSNEAFTVGKLLPAFSLRISTNDEDDAYSNISLEDIDDIRESPRSTTFSKYASGIITPSSRCSGSVKFENVCTSSSKCKFPETPGSSNTSGTKVIVGRNLSKRKIIRFDFELDEDHKNLHAHLASPNTADQQIFNLAELPTLQDLTVNVAIENFTDIKHLCDGSNSNIYKALFKNASMHNSSTQQTVILKTLKDTSAQNLIANDEFQKEIAYLSKMNHPHILKIFGAGFINSKLVQGMNKPLIVLEALDGDTLNYHLSLQRSSGSRPFTKTRYLRMAKEFASALKYLHDEISPECTLIHRDLKPDNIGFLEDGTLKLLDFGLAVCVRKNADTDGTYKLTGCTGSLRYMAPEVALNKPYNKKVDIYGFGMILYQLTTGVSPFLGYTKTKLFAKVFNEKYRLPLDYDDYGIKIRLPTGLSDLISHCWDDDHNKRPSAAKLYESIVAIEAEYNRKKLTGSGLRKGIDLVKKTLFTKSDSI